MHLDREAVDIERDAARRRPLRGARAAAGPQVPRATLGQAVAQRGAVGREAREDIEQSRLRGLTGQAFVERGIARSVPGGQFHGRIVGQPIGVVLGRIAQCQAVQPLAQQFDQGVANPVLPPRIDKLRGQPFRQTQPMIGLAQ